MGWGDSGPVSFPDDLFEVFHRGFNTVREVFENEIRYDFDGDCDLECEDVICEPCMDFTCPEWPACENFTCPDWPECTNLICPEIPECTEVTCPECTDVTCPDCNEHSCPTCT